ncbi:MAG: mitochondral 37S ribosomal protein S27 [Piccolia ochrophora]|nr:MAG: mitochondral 37S ribosomal protein S27 [Piccolia ochrophora]
MTVSRSRVLDLLKIQSRIFSTAFNPTNIRTGAKVLRQRLKGPSVKAYYPERRGRFKDFKNLFPHLDTWDDKEEDRLENLQITRSRGKGPPKKKRTAEESKKFAGRKKAAPKS